MDEKNQKTVEPPIAERRSEIAKRIHIVEMEEGFYVLEIPGADGAAFKAWPGPFETKRAAALFHETLLNAYAHGEPETVRCRGVVTQYELEARLLEFLEKREGISDPHKLAFELGEHRPWVRHCTDEIPF